MKDNLKKNIAFIFLAGLFTVIAYLVGNVSLAEGNNFYGHKNIIVPVIVKHTIRQGGSSNYSSSGNSSNRSNYGGGSSYGK